MGSRRLTAVGSSAAHSATTVVSVVVMVTSEPSATSDQPGPSSTGSEATRPRGRSSA